MYKQECIPVGCVSSAAVAVCIESAWGVSAQGGVYPGVCVCPGGYVSAQGVCVCSRGCLPKGEVSVVILSATSVEDGNKRRYEFEICIKILFRTVFRIQTPLTI